MKLFLILIIAGAAFAQEQPTAKAIDSRDATIAAQAALIKWQSDEIENLKAKITALNTFWQLEAQGQAHQLSKPAVPSLDPKSNAAAK